LKGQATDGETIDDLRMKELGQNTAHRRWINAVVARMRLSVFPRKTGSFIRSPSRP
jgi:hypothetical protein